MLDISLIKIIATISIAVLGWIIGHYFTNRRNRIQKRRDLTIEHLIKAYRILTTEIAHRQETKEGAKKLENILSDIQLFGSLVQVELAKNLIEVVVSGNEFELDPLINSLRNDLRKQLGLKKVEGNVKWLRFNIK